MDVVEAKGFLEDSAEERTFKDVLLAAQDSVKDKDKEKGKEEKIKHERMRKNKKGRMRG